MADQYMDMNTLRYFLFDVHGFEEILSSYARFQDYDAESVNMVLDSVKDFSDVDAFPYYKEMDDDPARYEDGKIYVHPKVGTIMKAAGELGLINGLFDYEDGGMQMPYALNQAAQFIIDAANINLAGYPGMATGAASLIVSYADESLKAKFTPKMLEGKWGGTMCLTEPQAGSSLSDITTTAYPQPDGTYKIKGQKIFISAGDIQNVDNIFH